LSKAMSANGGHSVGHVAGTGPKVLFAQQLRLYACAHQFWQRTCDESHLVLLTPLWTRTAHVVPLRMVRCRFPKLRYG
jgi:hypothetical protein